MGVTTSFPLGRILMTPGSIWAFKATKQSPGDYLYRHMKGDWGELSAHDKSENDWSIGRRLRILSAYKLLDGTKIWIITEADRSVTTILLPEEY